MTRLSLDLVSHAELARVSAALMSGSHVVLGTERDGTDTLMRLCAGFMPPSAGRITLDDRALFSHADLRRSAGSLFADEQLPPARDVTRSLGLALRARHDARSATSVLDAAGLTQFANRRVSTLVPREARALALLLALSHPNPTLLALFEPLTLIGLLSEELIVQALARHAAAGAVVLATASRIEDAARLGGATSALERGIWLDSAVARPPLSQVTLRVHTPEPRRLAARLSEAPEVSAVEWAGGRELLVRGTDLERVAAHVVASARSEALRIDALRCDPPGLDALAAARAGLARAWYERAATAPPIFAATKGSA